MGAAPSMWPQTEEIRSSSSILMKAGTRKTKSSGQAGNSGKTSSTNLSDLREAGDGNGGRVEMLRRSAKAIHCILQQSWRLEPLLIGNSFLTWGDLSADRMVYLANCPSHQDLVRNQGREESPLKQSCCKEMSINAAQISLKSFITDWGVLKCWLSSRGVTWVSCLRDTWRSLIDPGWIPVCHRWLLREAPAAPDDNDWD